MKSSGKPYRMWGAGIPYLTQRLKRLFYSELMPFLDAHILQD